MLTRDACAHCNFFCRKLLTSKNIPPNWRASIRDRAYQLVRSKRLVWLTTSDCILDNLKMQSAHGHDGDEPYPRSRHHGLNVILPMANPCRPSCHAPRLPTIIMAGLCGLFLSFHGLAVSATKVRELQLRQVILFVANDHLVNARCWRPLVEEGLHSE